MWLQWSEGGDKWWGTSRRGGRGKMRQDLAGIRTENVGAVTQDGEPPELEGDMIYVSYRLLWLLLGEETSGGHRGTQGGS